MKRRPSQLRLETSSRKATFREKKKLATKKVIESYLHQNREQGI